MGRAASEQLCRAIALVLMSVMSLPVFAQTTPLPQGIREASTVTGQAREQLAAYINENYETMKSGTIAQQRSARDNLLSMFDAASVSTAFRQASTSMLAPHIEESLSASSRWSRFAGYRLAAKLATEDSARWFTRAMDPNNTDAEKSDRLMALGQVRVMFLESDIGGLAVSQATLSRLATTIGQSLTETDDPDIALLQTRALRALAQGSRVELKEAHGAAAQALATAIAARHAARGNRAPGTSARDIDALLVDLEAMEAVRSYLVMRNATEAMPTPVAKALGQLVGQTLAFVTRTYENTPANADASRRYLQRMAQRCMEVNSILIVDYNSSNPGRPVDATGIPNPAGIAAALAGRDMQRVRLGVIRTLEILRIMYGFSDGWAKIE